MNPRWVYLSDLHNEPVKGMVPVVPQHEAEQEIARLMELMKEIALMHADDMKQRAALFDMKAPLCVCPICLIAREGK